MKLECSKNKLREAVILVERIAGKYPTMPILNTVFLKTADNVLSVRATNLEVGLEISLPVKTKTPGEVVVPAGAFSSFLNNLTILENLELSLNRGNLEIKTPLGLTTLKTFPSDDFPPQPQAGGSKDRLTVAAQDFEIGLRSVIYAASPSSLKPEITSVYFYVEGGELVLVATDTFRLAEKRVPCLSPAGEIAPSLIPLKNAGEILRIIEGLKEEVEIISSKNQLVLTIVDRRLTSTLVDGVFPDYRQIMPSKFCTEIVVEREELRQVLRLTQIFSNRFNQINLQVKAKDNQLIVQSFNQEIGGGELTLHPSIKGENIEVSVNVRHLLDAFSAITAETAVLQFTEHNRPILFSGLGDRTFRYLIMPTSR